MNHSAQMNGFGQSVAAASVAQKTIPFDYAFRFDLEGKPGLAQNSGLEVSVEATFTAVSIGYGVIPKANPITFGLPTPPPSPGPILLRSSSKSLFSATLFDLIGTLSAALDEDSDGKIGPRTAAVLQDGLRFNPRIRRAHSADAGDQPRSANFERSLSGGRRAAGASGIQVRALDQGSGREFQSEPILNIAGLGSPDGKRPFRYFARPIEFAPRSIIRMQITEVSAFQGELHVSLQGYKTLGQPGTPTGSRLQRHRRIRR